MLFVVREKRLSGACWPCHLKDDVSILAWHWSRFVLFRFQAESSCSPAILRVHALRNLIY